PVHRAVKDGVHADVGKQVATFRVPIIHELAAGRRIAAAEHRAEEAVMIVPVHPRGQADLAKVAEALGFARAVLAAAERGQDHAGEDGDDSHDDEQFDERERVPAPDAAGVWLSQGLTQAVNLLGPYSSTRHPGPTSPPPCGEENSKCLDPTRFVLPAHTHGACTSFLKTTLAAEWKLGISCGTENNVVFDTT